LEKMIGLRSIGRRMNQSDLKLKPDELLLNIIVTDSAIVEFAITSDSHRVILISQDEDKFNSLVKRAKREISSMGRPEEYLDDLLQISRVLFDQFGPIFEMAKSIIVIPDGFLNGLPFTLLSRTSTKYNH